MAITNGYATAVQVKARLDIGDYADDSQIESVIEAVSRWIDGPNATGRRIYAATETRYYTAAYGDILNIDDVLSITTLKGDTSGDGTYNETWATTDYYLNPTNAPLDNYPYDMIRIATNGTKRFPVGITKGVEIAGSFGYAATTPAAITEACILASMRVFKRKDILFGIQGSPETGQESALAQINRDGELNYLLDTIPRRLV